VVGIIPLLWLVVAAVSLSLVGAWCSRKEGGEMAEVLWVHGEGPLTVFVEGYRRLLERRGHSARSARDHLSLVGQLNRWLAGEGLGVDELNRARAELFLAARRAAGQRRVPTMRMLVPLFEYLQDLQVPPPQRPAAATALDELLVRYRHHLTHDRGLAPLTVLRYQRMAKRFLARRASRTGVESGVEGLDCDEINGYLLECRSRLVIESAKREAADLRSLLRFLYLQGLTGTDLGSTLPPVAG
jgi:site-specific recombinase XerD